MCIDTENHLERGASSVNTDSMEKGENGLRQESTDYTFRNLQKISDGFLLLGEI